MRICPRRSQSSALSMLSAVTRRKSNGNTLNISLTNSRKNNKSKRKKMKNLEKNKAKKGNLLLFLALLFLINPSIQVVDIFPDFIAYFIIINRISYATDRAPYFAEAKSALSKLTLVSLLKLPAYFVVVFARSGNVGDTDIYALFAFSFAFVEAIFSVIAVYYLFEGAFYIGQRTDAISLIRPFYINRKKTRT